jgi:hypothetical protein
MKEGREILRALRGKGKREGNHSPGKHSKRRKKRKKGWKPAMEGPMELTRRHKTLRGERTRKERRIPRHRPKRGELEETITSRKKTKKGKRRRKDKERRVVEG